MNFRTQVLVFGALCLPFLSSNAQLGGSRGSVSSQPFGIVAKVFADFPAFSAAFEHQIQSKSTSSIPMFAMPGTVARLDAKWRLDSHFGQAFTNISLVVPFAPGQDALDLLTNRSATLIWRLDKKVLWRTYPDIPVKGYFEHRLRDFDVAPPIQNATVLELSKQTIDGHPSVVNKLTVTDSRGEAREYTVWNATDLNGFPIRLQWLEHNNSTNVIRFYNVKLDRPDAALFEPPASQKYNAVGLVLEGLKAIRKARAARVTR